VNCADPDKIAGRIDARSKYGRNVLRSILGVTDSNNMMRVVSDSNDQNASSTVGKRGYVLGERDCRRFAFVVWAGRMRRGGCRQ
jgi:hypothetical protein